MPRPRKATVDYFPHFVISGKTMYTLESIWGNDGYAFWFKLLETLGSSEQHFIDCENAVDWQYLLVKTRVDEATANEILKMLAKLDAIDRDLWRLRIVRSKNFIDNLAALYNKRTIHVITNEEVKDICFQKRALENESNNPTDEDKSVGNPKDRDKYRGNPTDEDKSVGNPHRRGEERRVKDRREEEKKSAEERGNETASQTAQEVPLLDEPVSDKSLTVIDTSIAIKQKTAPPGNKTSRQVANSHTPEDIALYNKIKTTFEAVHGDFANYAKEGAAIHKIIQLAKSDEATVGLMLSTFHELIQGTNHFWSSQPYVPSRLLALWDSVKVEAQKQLEVNDVSWLEGI